MPAGVARITEALLAGMGAVRFEVPVTTQEKVRRRARRSSAASGTALADAEIMMAGCVRMQLGPHHGE